MSASLLVQEAQSPGAFLFSEETMKVLEEVRAERESTGDWTGERLFSRKPELYGAIVRMLGDSLPVACIARWLSVSDNTVRSVLEREQPTVADFRAHQVKRRRWALNVLVETIIREAPNAELKDAVIAYGILDDKDRLDAGAPTQRLAIDGVPAADEFRRFLHAQMIDGAVEVEVTGSERGTPAQRAAVPGGDRAEEDSTHE